MVGFPPNNQALKLTWSAEPIGVSDTVGTGKMRVSYALSPPWNAAPGEGPSLCSRASEPTLGTHLWDPWLVRIGTGSPDITP